MFDGIIKKCTHVGIQFSHSGTFNLISAFIKKRQGDVMQIFNEDCFAVMDRLSENSVDVIITSPPYNLGINYHTYKDKLEDSQYLDWLEAWSYKCKNVLSPNGSLFLNVGSKPSKPWVSMDVAQRVRNHLILQNHIYWIKSIAINDKSYGHIKPINSTRFLSDAAEDIFHFTKTGQVSIDRLAVGVPYSDKSNINRWTNKQDRRCKGNVWFIPYETRQSKNEHPAIFPRELVRQCLQLHGLQNIHTVFDPFAGSGTVLEVCAEFGLQGIGCEIDPAYFNIIQNKFKSTP
jgi:site-specific DNA-methyltransferase (adenine-specific)